MGRNAQLRIVKRRKAKQPRQTVPSAETKVMKRLQRIAPAIRTQHQLDEILETAPVEHRARIRALLMTMLPKDLPCCGPGMLEAATGHPQTHGRLCRTRQMVFLTDDEAMTAISRRDVVGPIGAPRTTDLVVEK